MSVHPSRREPIATPEELRNAVQGGNLLTGSDDSWNQAIADAVCAADDDTLTQAIEDNTDPSSWEATHIVRKERRDTMQAAAMAIMRMSQQSGGSP